MKIQLMAFAIVCSSFSAFGAPTIKYSGCSINTVSERGSNGKPKIGVWGYSSLSGNRMLVSGRRYNDDQAGGLEAYNELAFLKSQNICSNNDGTGIISE